MKHWNKIVTGTVLTSVLFTGQALAATNTSSSSLAPKGMQLLSQKTADVTGDNKADTVYLYGKKADKNSPYVSDLTIKVTDGSTKKTITIDVKDGGYEPKLSLQDFTYDKAKEIMVTADTGGSGGYQTNRIYTIKGQKAQQLSLPGLDKDKEGVVGCRARKLPTPVYRLRTVIPVTAASQEVAIGREAASKAASVISFFPFFCKSPAATAPPTIPHVPCGCMSSFILLAYASRDATSYLQSMDEGERKRYGQLLLSVLWNAAQQKGGIYSAFSNTRKYMERRIQMIWGNKPVKRKKSALVLTMCALLSVAYISTAFAYSGSQHALLQTDASPKASASKAGAYLPDESMILEGEVGTTLRRGDLIFERIENDSHAFPEKVDAILANTSQTHLIKKSEGNSM